MRDHLVTAEPAVNELAFYALAGAPENPRELLVEASEAERMGLGAAFLSERFSVKEAATLAGALGAVTNRIGIATAATNHHTRHPVIAASHAMTMHKLTGGRYSFGIGRGTAQISRGLGLAPVTTAQMADFVWLMRRLWSGETIIDHDGPAGRFPRLSLGTAGSARIPLTLSAFGPKSLTLGGRVFDAVVLHTFLSPEATYRAVQTVRSAAEKSGRDPSSVRVWSVLAIVGDHVPVDAQSRRIIGRLATYLQGYGELLVETNRWDPGVLNRFRRDLFVRSFSGPIDGQASDSELDHVATLLPPEWSASAAVGTGAECAAAIVAQLDLGVDGVILHGASPWELKSTVDAYRATRDPERFARLMPNPATLDRTKTLKTQPPMPPALTETGGGA